MGIFAELLCQNKPQKQIQTELLDCIYEVYKQTLVEEIQNNNFVSIKLMKRLVFHSCLSFSYCCDMLNVTAQLKDIIFFCSSSKLQDRRFSVSFKSRTGTIQAIKARFNKFIIPHNFHKLP
jgi:hypothetical protein